MNLLIGIIVGIIIFRLTYRFSEYFIAPREHWRKSRFDIQYLKYSMALTAGVTCGLAVAIFMK